MPYQSIKPNDGNRRDMAEALAFATDGKVKADIELEPLSAISAAF
jgi:propanol-preferring alcohol dehydrogenase